MKPSGLLQSKDSSHKSLQWQVCLSFKAKTYRWRHRSLPDPQADQCVFAFCVHIFTGSTNTTHSSGEASCQGHLQVSFESNQSRNQDENLCDHFEDLPVLPTHITNWTLKRRLQSTEPKVSSLDLFGQFQFERNFPDWLLFKPSSISISLHGFSSFTGRFCSCSSELYMQTEQTRPKWAAEKCGDGKRQRWRA